MARTPTRSRLFGTALVAALVAATQLTAAPAQAGPAIYPPPSTSATAVSATQIRVSWQAAPQASSYRISRSTGSSGPYTQVGSSTSLEFLDSGLAPATTYYYVVLAEYRNKLSGQSPQASATTLPVLPAPNGLRLTGSPSTMELTWTAVPGADRYEVYRHHPIDGDSLITSTTEPSFRETGRSDGYYYQYKVRALTANGAAGPFASGAAYTGLPTTTTIAVNPTRSEQGQWVALSARVRTADGSEPWGKVVFLSGSEVIGQATLWHGYAATVTTPKASSMTYYARFEGYGTNPNNGGSSSADLPLQVDPAYGEVSFGPSEAARVGSTETAIAAGDLTGDGLTDVVLTTGVEADAGDLNHSAYLYVQLPEHRLAAPVRYATSTPTGGSMVPVIADLDGDGRNELLVASGDGLDLYRQSTGGLAAPVALPFGASLGDVHVVDLDQDGTGDLVATVNESVLVRYGTGSGEFTAPTAVPTPLSGPVLGIADVTGGPGLDLVRLDGRNVIVAEQTSARTFAPTTGIPVPEGQEIDARSFATGDVTGDGRADVVVTVTGNMPDPRVSVLTHDASGTLGPWQVYVAYDMPEPVVLEDMDGDSRLDVVIAHGGWYRVGVMLQRPDGRLGREQLGYNSYYASHYEHRGLAVGDINSDGHKDVLLADYNNGIVVIPGA
ncbi:FG-GAP-like repeat-containing protein [Micromonospora krabiensis]|uniref:Fibronectin type III domain-containing protein n=1 Tax=Micromonospora krabiensis TaxID=307121 RepID=A0A1C3N594_9ACTN|nr:FG-GAP-like repeat-containing protein [Micromonospora krabiensis]SBV27716.1 Fibronectin type III domain-containing protein [Micromonospora krabiensis]